VKRYSTFYKEEGFAAAPDKTKILAELETLDEIEKKQVMLALNATDNNKSKAADILGIDRATLFRKLKKYGIS
jgi:transcriptional regulator of acetoin/glycerol metabolism